MTESIKYEYTKKCDEISGFGGSYEDACRRMVIRGMYWFDKHPKVNPKFSEYENIYGIIMDKTPSAKALMKHMTKDIDCTGAMVQATINHCLKAHHIGWKTYIKMMEKRD